MLRYTILLTATLCVAFFSEMAANERPTMRIAGEISEPHAYFWADCQACHEPWHGPSREQCIACHVIDRQSPEGVPREAAGKPPTQTAAARDEPLQCADCHKEHLGLPKLVKAPLYVAREHPPEDPERGWCLECHRKVDHGRILGCAFGPDCHPGADLTKTTKKGAHARMKPL